MKWKSALLLTILVLGSSAQVTADRRTSLDEAVSEARDRHPGRVLSAETDRRGGRESYKIRILTDDGRVRRLNMDAESGRFEKRKGRRSPSRR